MHAWQNDTIIKKKWEKKKEFDWINLLYLFHVCVKWFAFYKCNIDIYQTFPFETQCIIIKIYHIFLLVPRYVAYDSSINTISVKYWRCTENYQKKNDIEFSIN